MTKKLMKNLMSFTLMCAIIVTACVALYAASKGDSSRVMSYSLSATKNVFGDSASGRTSDALPTHNCIADGVPDDIDPWSYLEVIITCSGPSGQISSTPFMIYNDNYVTGTVNTGFGVNLTGASSSHKAEIYCENESDFATLSVEAD